MERNPAEKAATDRFDTSYARLGTAVMRQITQRVFCCNYPGNSWTTREEADDLVRMLGLVPETTLLDLGSGAGWPALYLASVSGCKAVLVDLPESGLRIGRERARTDGLDKRVQILKADAADLPFPDAAFGAVNHSDLLCCLIPKRQVLRECRRVIVQEGRMVFSVISVPQSLSPDARRQGIAAGPEFVDTDASYPDMLADTGWLLLERRDLTDAYHAALVRQENADREAGHDLVELIGPEMVDERMSDWQAKRRSVESGLLVRELFVVKPS